MPIEFTSVNHTSLSCKDLTIQSKSKSRPPLVEQVSFEIPSGSVFAIMGGSGSGKTTLLNACAKRSSTNSKLQQLGSIYYNNSPDLNSVDHAYVIQQDILVPQLTCYETLKFSARLRLSEVSETDQDELIHQIINELGLKDCQNTMVGNRQHKGLSGGEKRRLSIAIQLLSNPSLLFLDEPTTGLDAHAAILLLHTLRSLARQGRTIVMSIHQPPSEAFFMFDHLCILSRGFPVYCGASNKVLPYFEKLGFQVPENSNPADFLVDITSVDTRSPDNEKITMERFERFKQARLENKEIEASKEAAISTTSTKEVSVSKFHKTHKHSPVHLFKEVKILVEKELLLTSRDPLTSLGLLMESAFMGVVLGWVFYKPDDTLTGIRSTTGAIYCVNGLQGYLMLVFETYRLCFQDIKIFDRERNEGSVSVLGFMISRRISKFITEDFAIPTVFTIITYFMLGIKLTGKGFGIFWSVNLFNHQIAMATAILAVGLSRDYAIASTVCNVNFTFQSYCSGYFLNTAQMPVYVRWIKYLCYVWYAYGLTASSQFTDYFGDCPSSDDPSDPRCASYTGANILKTLGFWENWTVVPECALLAVLIIFSVLAYVFLTVNKVDVAIAKQSKKPKSSKNSISESLAPKKTNEELEGISVSIQDISLSVKVIDISVKSLIRKFNPLSRKSSETTKQILEDVSASFRKHKVNAIMGPSGSGKTSLLNCISGKLKSSVSREYNYSGNIFFNEHLVDKNILSDVCCYVLQDDDSLLPALTVRETLMYSGKMKLSRTHTSQQIEDRVNEVILKLGLKECQNNLIGSELVKGISGGEKRRVSIGLQLLNNPQIIFLDEPTSGLDSFTALSILSILEHLATVEHKTVVLTIHQPRYSMFQRFGQVTLLAKGGRVVFNGSPPDMKDYFEKLGYVCPKLTNFADFVLDLVSVNVQSADLETSTKKRVEQLIEFWENSEKHDLEEKQVEFMGKNVSSEASEKDTSEELKESRVFFKKYEKKRAPFRSAFRIVLRRQWKNLRIAIIFSRVFQTAGTGIISAVFYSPIKKNYVGITNILGLVQQISSVYFVGMLNNVALYPEERNYFYEEYADKVYGLTPFFLSYTIWENVFEFLASGMYAAFAVMVIGLPRTPGVFFCFAYSCWLLVSCGESLGILFNTIFDHTGFAINVISTFLSMAVFMSGLISLELPPFFKGINYVNPVHYAVMSSINVVFKAEKRFTCSASEGSDGQGGCIFSNGEQVLDGYGITVNWKLYLGLLAVMAVSYRMVTFIVLWIKVSGFKMETIRRWIS